MSETTIIMIAVAVLLVLLFFKVPVFISICPVLPSIFSFAAAPLQKF